jgi:hypothetical protein
VSVAAEGPNRRYAAVRGTQRDVLQQLRCGDWTLGVPALARRVGRPAGNVWLAVGLLSDRGMVKYMKRADGVLRIWCTRAGRAIRL